jgi:hypothetical protein
MHDLLVRVSMPRGGGYLASRAGGDQAHGGVQVQIIHSWPDLIADFQKRQAVADANFSVTLEYDPANRILYAIDLEGDHSHSVYYSWFHLTQNEADILLAMHDEKEEEDHIATVIQQLAVEEKKGDGVVTDNHQDVGEQKDESPKAVPSPSRSSPEPEGVAMSKCDSPKAVPPPSHLPEPKSVAVVDIHVEAATVEPIVTVVVTPATE